MIRIGCCGYPVSVKRYQEVFSLVELNSTFYRYPRLQTAMKWRGTAPEAFEFTVKAHQDISHKYKLRLESSREPYERMKEICRTLNAEILLIQTPASFKPDSLNEAERFFEHVLREGLALVWETRGPLWEEAEAREKLRTVLERLDIPHVTDPFRTMPVYTNRVAYFRLHGLGTRMYYYQYTDEELLKLYEWVRGLDTVDRRVYLFFNSLSMFDDARRFLSFIKCGRFPSVTGAMGAESVKVVVGKTRYPLTGSALIEKVGWRLIELEDQRQVRLSELLRGLQSKSFKSIDDVLREVNL